MGTFIQITLDDSKLSPDLAQKLVSLCPVDIFKRDGDRVTVDADQEDECTLCRLCLTASMPGAIRIFKTYTGETLESHGA